MRPLRASSPTMNATSAPTASERSSSHLSSAYSYSCIVLYRSVCLFAASRKSCRIPSPSTSLPRKECEESGRMIDQRLGW